MSDPAAASASSRKRPRHFQQGPNEAEEDRVEQAAAAQPPSARLYKHALESIFAFLSIQELSAVLAVSRLWSSAVDSMRSIAADVTLSTAVSLAPLRASRLVRHIGSLGSGDLDAPLPLRCRRLSSLAPRLTGLRSLACELVGPVELPLLFSPSLTRLHLRTEQEISPAEVHSIVAAVSRVTNLTSLTLSVWDDGDSVNLALLAKLPQLRELDMEQYGDSLWELTEQQIDQLRALPHLTALPYLLTEEPLQLLLRPPHALQLQTLRLYAPGGSESKAARRLASLPALTDLEVDDNRDVTFLQFTPNLRKLHISNLALYAPLTVQEMIGGVGPCTQLTHLIIYNCKLKAKHIRAMLSLMPVLNELELGSMFGMESLSFLSES